MGRDAGEGQVFSRGCMILPERLAPRTLHLKLYDGALIAEEPCSVIFNQRDRADPVPLTYQHDHALAEFQRDLPSWVKIKDQECSPH